MNVARVAPMLTRRDPSSPVTLSGALGSAPHCHGGASSLLRLGLGAAPKRLLPAARLVVERPFLLRHRPPSRQLDLFGALRASR